MQPDDHDLPRLDRLLIDGALNYVGSPLAACYARFAALNPGRSSESLQAFGTRLERLVALGEVIVDERDGRLLFRIPRPAPEPKDAV